MDKNKEKLLDIFKDDQFGLLDIKPKTTIRNEDDRLVASFQEILDFFKENNREPERDKGIAEASLYYRLQGIRENNDKVCALKDHDTHNLLMWPTEVNSIKDIFMNDTQGILESEEESIFTLNHVPKEITMPDYVARRKPCKEFESFDHLFKKCQADLKSGKRKLLPLKGEQQIEKGDFFVLRGVLLYVEDVGERKVEKGKINARLRCIFENGTESDMLLRSLSTDVYKHGRRVTELEDTFLDRFNNISEEDEESGFIYILRSKSKNPEIKAINNLYKIGFTKTSVEERTKNAEQDPTFLMAPVSIVTFYKCYNMNPQKLEYLLHTFFGNSCLNIEVIDKKGSKYSPKEWFIAPLSIIEDAINLVISEDIVDFKYDSFSQMIVRK